MAQAVASWWGGLSDFYKGLSVIVATAMATAATILTISSHLGLPSRMDAAETAIEHNTNAIRDVGTALRGLEAGQLLQTCLILAVANETNPLECTR